MNEERHFRLLRSSLDKNFDALQAMLSDFSNDELLAADRAIDRISDAIFSEILKRNREKNASQSAA